MCTAITYKTKDCYFGRTLDYGFSYEETVTVTPRNYPFRFRMVEDLEAHYALIGMAYVVGEYPLYYEATNEKGLSMAGLNFPKNAVYQKPIIGKKNVAPFELIPWIVGQCETLKDVRTLIEDLNVVNINFSDELPVSPLHWMIADKDEAIVVEAVEDGLKIYDNPVGVMTNNPSFDKQLFNLNQYMHLSPDSPKNKFSENLVLENYSLGMGAVGLPGDWSSPSRFVKVAFAKQNAVSGEAESESVSQFFHVLHSVFHPRGVVRMADGSYEITIYSCCCNVDKGIYYYTTYENSQITAVDMYRENLDGIAPVSYPLVTGQHVYMQN